MKKKTKKTFTDTGRLSKNLRTIIKDKISTKIEIIALVLILIVFGFKVLNYIRIKDIQSTAGKVYGAIDFKIGELKYFGECPKSQIKIDVEQEYLCRAATKSSVYQKIFDTYPRDSNGSEIIYPELSNSNLLQANDLLNNQYIIPGFNEVQLKYPLSWQEDPFNNLSWRQDYYSLQVFKDLLYADESNKTSAYTQRLNDVLTSFLNSGTNQLNAWNDNTTVAYRAMMLDEIWWHMRANNQLSISLSNAILLSIEQHGQYLMSSNHFDSETYLDTDEAASLYMLGVSFPTLPNSKQWLVTGQERLSENINSLVGSDGALIQNSPSQEFSVLAKVWEINNYSRKYNSSLSKSITQKLAAMINYATYILKPNSELPVTGRSTNKKIVNSGVIKEIAAESNGLAYTLSEGQSGSMPKDLSIQFKSVGQTIMRSAWAAGNFKAQTQLVFNYGTTSTQYAHLDDLSFELYGDGSDLLPGSTIPTSTSPAINQYFLGTESHNTVLVDGQNQIAGGTGSASNLVTKAGYVSQSASDLVNPGVTHERQLIMLDKSTVLLIDKLHSSTSHTYQQLFHLSPNSTYDHKGTTVIENEGGNLGGRLTISQLAPQGIALSDSFNNIGQKNSSGLCAINVNTIIPCHQVSYNQKTANATYVTLLQIGTPDPGLHYQYSSKNNTVTIMKNAKIYTIKINEVSSKPLSASITKTALPKPTTTAVSTFKDLSTWHVSNGDLAISNDGPRTGSTSLSLTSNNFSPSAVMQKNTDLNLSDKNLVFNMKVPNTFNVHDIDLVLYSDNSSYAEDALQSAYNSVTDNDQAQLSVYPSSVSNNGWVTISLGKGAKRDAEGEWQISGSSFNWSHITGIAFRLGGKSNAAVQALFSDFSTQDAQSSGKVLITFDDGTSSVLAAANAMQNYNFVGNIGVIGKYPHDNSNGYLTISRLRELQDQGWSLINHSFYHQDAVTQYYDEGRLNDLNQDILQGAEFLQENGLNSDQNWYIYPHGTTNAAVQQVVGRYYKFARTELTGPEVYPFGNDLSVKDFVVENDTPPQSIENAIEDAKTYNLTLILTFHRIHSKQSDQSGYDLGEFEDVLNFLNKTKVKVMSFNQLDQSNHVPINKLTINDGTSAQITSTITVKSPSPWQRLKQYL